MGKIPPFHLAVSGQKKLHGRGHLYRQSFTGRLLEGQLVDTILGNLFMILLAYLLAHAANYHVQDYQQLINAS